MQDEASMSQLLTRSTHIAVVGAKDKPGHPVDGVGRYLIRAGYTIFPVHPKRRSVWGLTAYPTLLDIPEPIHIVDLFRAPEYCPDHAREVLQLSVWPLLFWMQEGISSQEVHTILEGTPVRIVEDHCLLKFHKRVSESGHV